MFLLAGLEKPTSGNVIYNNQDITLFSDAQQNNFRQNEIGLIFQSPHLITELTVLENIIIRGLIRNDPIDACKEKAILFLEQFGLKNKANMLPYTLSGGEQQRIAIIRAIFNKPSFLLADEPTAHLDKENCHAIINALRTYQSTHSMGLIISSHDPFVISQMDVILEVKDGYLVQS